MLQKCFSSKFTILLLQWVKLVTPGTTLHIDDGGRFPQIEKGQLCILLNKNILKVFKISNCSYKCALTGTNIKEK